MLTLPHYYFRERPKPMPGIQMLGAAPLIQTSTPEIQRFFRIVWLGFLALVLSGCAVTWVSPYEKSSVERTTEISKNILSLYQSMLATELDKRADALKGGLQTKHGDIETQIRLHLLLEQARTKNSESVTIATNLLASWQAFSKNHQSKDPTALGDAALTVERGILERHLRAALIAEESKKLGG